MTERDFTGTITYLDGSDVAAGILRIIPIRPSPADASGAVVPKYIDVDIDDGDVAGTLLAPARYQFQVLVNEELIWNWYGGITEVMPPDPLTIQAIYAASVDPSDVVVLQGDTVYTVPYSGAGAVSNGTLMRYLSPDTIVFSSARGVLTTASSSIMTMTITVDLTHSVVFNWAIGATVATVTGLPVTAALNADMPFVISGCTGAANLRFYLRGTRLV